jgi:hypothetical protein
MVYYHLFQFPQGDALAGMWRTIWHWQMRQIEYSGLAQHGCRLGVIGTKPERDKMKIFAEQYPWLTVAKEVDHSENEGLFEGATLKLLWDEVRAHHDSGGTRRPVLYHHAKGSASENLCVQEWRELMTYFCVERWREAVRCIEAGYDLAGVNYKPAAVWPHFSGNFWWASTDYIAKLPDPLSLGYYEPDECRVRYEMWVGLGRPSAVSLHESNSPDHYRCRYEPWRYRR